MLERLLILIFPAAALDNDEVLIKITPSLGFLIDDKFHNCDEEYDDEIDDWVEARHNLNCEIMQYEPDHLARVLSGEWFKGTPHEIKGGGLGDWRR